MDDKLLKIADMIADDLKYIGTKPYNDGSLQSYAFIAKLDVYVKLLLILGYSKVAIVGIYKDNGIDYSHILNDEYEE